ncbi:hypothetical protein EMPS_09318 [Entomortierella parvispora]|uniref:C3H1-type domain-containing protein n=1 Tax=Entomortierella parvispora TaxID=205924 RepID=A0A9P3M057_9FUNG|nr:hypothetical protein EMPS_09318 [Entomortierella parvispora]
MASSNSIANNTAVRLGAAALLSGVLIYWIWASTQSSSEPSAPEGASGKSKKKKSSKSSTTTTVTTETTTTSSSSSAPEKIPEPSLDSKASSKDASVIADIPESSSSVPLAEAADHTTEKDDTVAMHVTDAEEVVQVLEKEISVAHTDAQLEMVVENLQASVLPKEEIVLEEIVLDEQEVEATEVVEDIEQVESVEELEELEQHVQDTDVGAETPTTLVGDESDLAHTHNDTTSHAQETIVQEDKPVSDKAKSLTSAVADKAQTLQEVSREAQHTELNAKAPVFQPTWMMQNGTSAPAQAYSTPARLSVDLSRQNLQQTTQQQYQQHSQLQQQQQQSSGQAVKIKARCRFWPNCTNKSCKFTHPSLPCRDPDNCSFGDRCNFIHPKDLIPRPPRKDKKDGARPNGRGKPRPGSTDSTSTLTDDVQVNYTGPK